MLLYHVKSHYFNSFMLGIITHTAEKKSSSKLCHYFKFLWLFLSLDGSFIVGGTINNCQCPEHTTCSQWILWMIEFFSSLFQFIESYELSELLQYIEFLQHSNKLKKKKRRAKVKILNSRKLLQVNKKDSHIIPIQYYVYKRTIREP